MARAHPLLLLALVAPMASAANGSAAAARAKMGEAVSAAEIGGAAPAQAQTPSLGLAVGPRGGVDYGDATRISGRLSRGGTPLARQPIVLEARRFPYRGAFRRLRTLRTDRRGRFELRRRFDRNHRVRVRAPRQRVTSRTRSVFVFPAFRLTYRLLRENVVRLTQVYTTPRDVRTVASTSFYLGPRNARTAPFRTRRRTRRIRPGRFVSRATLRVPARYEGRFRYASCFRADPRAGMGDPAQRCPTRAFRFNP